MQRTVIQAEQVLENRRRLSFHRVRTEEGQLGPRLLVGEAVFLYPLFSPVTDIFR